MIKGIQKNMIQLQISGNRYFETAYFVLRHDLRPPVPRENEMVREAQRILAESELSKKKSTRGGMSRLVSRRLSFLWGALAGAATVAFIWLFVLWLR